MIHNVMAPRVMRRFSVFPRSCAVTIFGCSPVSSEQLELFDEVLRRAQNSDLKGRASLRKAIKRRKPDVYNAFMRDASNRGSISLMEEAVACMRRDSVQENAWTAAVRINAYSRVGRIEEAQAVLKEADSFDIGPIGNAAIAPLVRGLMEPRFTAATTLDDEKPVARIQGALQLVHKRLSDTSVEFASFRTINTLLRGCKRWSPHLAASLLESFHRPEGHHPSTLALAVECACATLNTARAVDLLHELSAQGASADAALLTEVTTAHALCGELPEASAMLTRALDAVAAIEIDNYHSDRKMEAAATSPLKRRGIPQGLLKNQHALLARYLQKGGFGDVKNGQGVQSSHFVSYPAHDAQNDNNRMDSGQEHLQALVQRSQRVCVEVGAGSGDWLIAQAVAHPHVAWVAVEPQLDRVHQIVSKVALNHLSNVHVCATSVEAVFGGDDQRHGSKPTQGWLPKHSVDEVHVRFPYPPSLELPDLLAPTLPMNCGMLSSGNFLDGTLRVLKPRGTLHVVTSEPAYCALMLASLRQHPVAFGELVSTQGQAGFSREPPQKPPTCSQSMQQKDRKTKELSFFDAALIAGGHMERYELNYLRI